jgi:TatD DNase family protein
MRLSSTVMHLVDVHCHLTAAAFKMEIETLIPSFRSAGLKHIILNGLDPKDNNQVFDLCDRFNIANETPFLLPATGIYPLNACASVLYNLPSSVIPNLNINDLGELFDVDEEIGRIESWAAEKRIVAIGECGLDSHYTNHPDAMKEQERVLRSLMRVAKQNDLPLILHSRKAEDRVFEMLLEGRPPYSVCYYASFLC